MSFKTQEMTAMPAIDST